MALRDSNGNRIFPPFIINGIRHPDNIEDIWTDAQLLAIGLERYVPPPPPPDPVTSVSRKQFCMQLYYAGIITKPQLQSILKTGTLPTPLANAVTRLSGEDTQIAADALLSTDGPIPIGAPVVQQLKTDAGWTDAQLQAFFNSASAR